MCTFGDIPKSLRCVGVGVRVLEFQHLLFFLLRANQSDALGQEKTVYVKSLEGGTKKSSFYEPNLTPASSSRKPARTNLI